VVRSPRQAANLLLRLEPEAQLQAAEVNGKKLTDLGAANRAKRIFYWAAPPEGVRVTLKVGAGRPVKLTVLDQSYGLPVELQGVYRPRPTHLIPMGLGADTTFVARTYWW
jgi:hypothetical protein